MEKKKTFRNSFKGNPEAVDLLNETKEWIKGFEVVQGTLDDVFLNITNRDRKEVMEVSDENN